MASGMYEEMAKDVLDHFVAGTSVTASTQADVRVALTTGTASKSSIGTDEIDETSDGYTDGGEAYNTGAALTATTDSGTAVIENDDPITWTNSNDTTAWEAITNIVLHKGGDTCSAANGLFFISGLNIVLPASATLTIPAGNLKFQIGS